MTDVSEQQWLWLETTLREAAAGPLPHIIPVMHHPPFLQVCFTGLSSSHDCLTKCISKFYMFH